MAELYQAEDVNQYNSLPRVGIVQNIGDVTVVRGNQTIQIPPSFRIPSRDAFLALHRTVLRISSSVELSVSSKASSQETLDREPSAVARWSERFEETFQSETSLATDAARIDEEEEYEEQENVKTDEALPNTKLDPCDPLVISPDCASITSASCPSIASGSITGFEFPVVSSDRTTVNQSNGDNTLSTMGSNLLL